MIETPARGRVRDITCFEHPQAARPAAVTAVVDALARLHPTARRWTSDPASAEDLLHDTLERALRNLHQFDLGTCARAWLTTIMRRIAIDDARRRQYQHRMQVRHPVELRAAGVGVSDPDAEEAPEAADLPQVYQRAAVLAEPLRTTFLLWAKEGLTYRQISQRTGTAVPTVGTRLHRARNELRNRR